MNRGRTPHTRPLFVAILSTLLLLSSCVTPPVREPAADGDLLRWTDTTLVPYLKRTLTEHPRLRGETFAVVRTRDGEIQPRIDGLTLELRRRITDALTSGSGVHMARAPSRGHNHHRRLHGADCRDRLRAGYFIAVEVAARTGGGRDLSVRILDAAEQAWVNGFGLNWSGRLSAAQRRALDTAREDGLLRGLRVLPFTADQPDLAAAYFANNLSCLIQQLGLSEHSLYVEPLEQAPPQLATLVSLLDNNLSRLHQVEIAERRAEAEYLVQSELHHIDRDLYQLWVALRPRDSGIRVSGLDTDAYFKLPPEPAVARPPHRRPRVTGLRLLHPARPGTCAMATPWSGGGTPVTAEAPAAPGECLLLEAAAEHSEALYLLYLDPAGHLARLAPDHRCGGARMERTAGGLHLTYAAGGYTPPLADRAGIATLYALAVEDKALARRLERHLLQLPDACSVEAGYRQPPEWTRELDRLLASRPGAADWTALRVRFEPWGND